MSTAQTSAEVGFETFEKLGIDYEHAYGNNPLKKACIERTISLLSDSDGKDHTVLDVGCGTGKPVSEMLATAGLKVTGIDISPEMIKHAQSRIEGDFIVADLLGYKPETLYDAVVISFSLLQLTAYSEFYDLMIAYANAVRPGGYLVIGTMPADNYVKDEADYDETGTYTVDYLTPFMGVMEKTFMLTAQGLVDYVTTMGFSVVSNEVGVFYVHDPRCVPEDQQYVIAQRKGDGPLSSPLLKRAN